MTFNPNDLAVTRSGKTLGEFNADHPRNTDGKFTEKTGGAAEVSLVPTSESRAGSFARTHTFADVNDQFEGLVSPENLYMDGEASPAYAKQRLAGFTANYATRLVEISDDVSASEFLHFATQAVKGASRPSDIGQGARVGHVNAVSGADVTLFVGGRPQAEATANGTILIDRTRGGRLLIKKGSDVLVGVTEGSEITVEFEEGASGRVVSAGDTTLIGNKNVELVGSAKAGA